MVVVVVLAVVVSAVPVVADLEVVLAAAEEVAVLSLSAVAATD